MDIIEELKSRLVRAGSAPQDAAGERAQAEGADGQGARRARSQRPHRIAHLAPVSR